MSRAAATLALLLGALLLSACGSGPTVEVEPGPIAQRLVARAVVVPRDGVARVRAPVAARVESVGVAEGETVERGQELASLDTERRGPAPAIEAPVSGVVLARRVSVGDDVGPADPPLFELADPSRVELRFELVDEDSARVSVGDLVVVTARGGGPALARGQVARLSARMEAPQIGQSELVAGRAGSPVRAGWVELEPDAALALGRELEAVIELPPHEAEARVPRDAVVIRGGRMIVRRPRVHFDQEVEVRIGLADDRHVEVEGIEAGTRIRARARS